MSDLNPKLSALVEASRKACDSWLVADLDGGLRLIDPVDQSKVTAHYGDSHLAAALITLGRSRSDDAMVEQGQQLIRTVLRDWLVAESSADFHHDFNTFALCLAVEQLGPEESDLARAIKKVVINASDSRHDTVNWLPMRAYVNLSRHEWTGNQKFSAIAEKILKKIESATNDDGGIEDRLPKGRSYNLQYNISSLATLILIKKRWPEKKISAEKNLDFLISKILPDGDINYMGRGANQIFAWGPWLFALAAAGRTNVLDSAVQYLSSRYPLSVERSNLLLNGFSGHEKSFWWDYHYCSVYHAHFLMWTVLALMFAESAKLNITLNQAAIDELRRDSSATTGLTLIRNEAGGAALFEGRSGYLAEAGPSVCALWLSEEQILFKGGLGPWKGDFGKKYSFGDAIFQNYFGLISQPRALAFDQNRLTKKFMLTRAAYHEAVIKPKFSKIEVGQESGAVKIVFEGDGDVAYCNIPIFEDQADHIELNFFADAQPLRQQLAGKSRNQYGWISLFRSELTNGRRWEVHIKPKGYLK